MIHSPIWHVTIHGSVTEWHACNIHIVDVVCSVPPELDNWVYNRFVIVPLCSLLILCMFRFIWIFFRGWPWRYSVIPSTPDFLTEYQIRRHSNPAGLPTLPWSGDPDLGLASFDWPAHMFKQIQNKLELLWWRCSKSITVHQIKYANLYAMTWNTGECCIVYSALGFMPVATPDFQSWKLQWSRQSTAPQNSH